jgi:hypothetical protein
MVDVERYVQNKKECVPPRRKVSENENTGYIHDYKSAGWTLKAIHLTIVTASNLKAIHHLGNLSINQLSIVVVVVVYYSCPCSIDRRFFNHFERCSILGMPLISMGIQSVGNPKHIKEYIFSTNEPTK